MSSALHRRRRGSDNADRDDGRDAAHLRPAPARAARPRHDPFLGPVLPDPGVDFQLVHTEDVATALAAAVVGRASRPLQPGRTGRDERLEDDEGPGWWSAPVPGSAVATLDSCWRRSGAARRDGMADRLPRAGSEDTRKAREQLGWDPRWDAQSTLRETIAVRASPRALGEVTQHRARGRPERESGDLNILDPARAGRRSASPALRRRTPAAVFVAA